MHAGAKRVPTRPKHTPKKVYLPLHSTYIPFTRKNSHTQIYTRACASTCIYACTYTLTTTLTLTFEILCSSQPHSPSSQSPPTTYTYAHVTCTGRLRHDCIRTDTRTRISRRLVNPILTHPAFHVSQNALYPFC